MKLNAKIASQPFNLFLATAILLLVFPAFMRGHTIDIHLEDSFIVLSSVFLTWSLAIAFFLVWSIYKLASKILWKRILSWAHVLVTIFILIMVLAIDIWSDIIILQIKNGLSSYETLQEERRLAAKIIMPVTVLFLLAQLAFIVNIIGGLISKSVKQVEKM